MSINYCEILWTGTVRSTANELGKCIGWALLSCEPTIHFHLNVSGEKICGKMEMNKTIQPTTRSFRIRVWLEVSLSGYGKGENWKLGSLRREIGIKKYTFILVDAEIEECIQSFSAELFQLEYLSTVAYSWNSTTMIIRQPISHPTCVSVKHMYQ